MIAVRCCRCSTELNAPGALAFGPPTDAGMVHKYHVCGDCWLMVHGVLRGLVWDEDYWRAVNR